MNVIPSGFRAVVFAACDFQELHWIYIIHICIADKNAKNIKNISLQELFMGVHDEGC